MELSPNLCRLLDRYTTDEAYRSIVLVRLAPKFKPATSRSLALLLVHYESWENRQWAIQLDALPDYEDLSQPKVVKYRPAKRRKSYLTFNQAA